MKRSSAGAGTTAAGGSERGAPAMSQATCKPSPQKERAIKTKRSARLPTREQASEADHRGAGNGSRSRGVGAANALAPYRRSPPSHVFQVPELRNSLIFDVLSNSDVAGASTDAAAAAEEGEGRQGQKRTAGPIVTETWARSLIKPEDEYLLYERTAAAVANYGGVSVGGGGAGAGGVALRARLLEGEVRRKQTAKLLRHQQQQYERRNSTQSYAGSIVGGATDRARTQDSYARVPAGSARASYVSSAGGSVVFGGERRVQSVPLTHSDVAHRSSMSAFAPGARVYPRRRAASTVSSLVFHSVSETASLREGSEVAQRGVAAPAAPELLSAAEEVRLAAIAANEKQINERNAQLFFRRPSYQLFETRSAHGALLRRPSMASSEAVVGDVALDDHQAAMRPSQGGGPRRSILASSLITGHAFAATIAAAHKGAPERVSLPVALDGVRVPEAGKRKRPDIGISILAGDGGHQGLRAAPTVLLLQGAGSTPAATYERLLRDDPIFFVTTEENHHRLEVRNAEYLQRQRLRQLYENDHSPGSCWDEEEDARLSNYTVATAATYLQDRDMDSPSLHRPSTRTTVMEEAVLAAHNSTAAVAHLLTRRAPPPPAPRPIRLQSRRAKPAADAPRPPPGTTPPRAGRAAEVSSLRKLEAAETIGTPEPDSPESELCPCPSPEPTSLLPSSLRTPPPPPPQRFSSPNAKEAPQPVTNNGSISPTSIADGGLTPPSMGKLHHSQQQQQQQRMVNAVMPSSKAVPVTLNTSNVGYLGSTTTPRKGAATSRGSSRHTSRAGSIVLQNAASRGGEHDKEGDEKEEVVESFDLGPWVGSSPSPQQDVDGDTSSKITAAGARSTVTAASEELQAFVRFFRCSALASEESALLNPSANDNNNGRCRRAFLRHVRNFLRLEKPELEGQRHTHDGAGGEGEDPDDPLDDGSYHQQNVRYVLEVFGNVMRSDNRFGTDAAGGAAKTSRRLQTNGGAKSSGIGARNGGSSGNVTVIPITTSRPASTAALSLLFTTATGASAAECRG